MKTLLYNIKELIQVREHLNNKFLKGEEMKTLPSIKNAWLLIEDGKISNYGSMEDMPAIAYEQQVDLNGKMVLPSWVDSHTHLVYAGNREQEFVDRINGLTYEEIAKKGGGIKNSAKKLQETPEDQLYKEAAARLEEVIKMGTGAIEIKSGYGLTTEAELKILRVIKRLKENYPISIKSTFLAAHAVPKSFHNSKAYVEHIIKDMLPVVAKEKLADYIDIFCEKGYFTVEDTKNILEAGAAVGLQGKVHVNQFNAIGGIQESVKQNALSVDHLEIMQEEDYNTLKNTQTMPVALPSCSLFIGIPYAPARKIIDKGLPLALATDYNPGTTPSGNMNLVVSLACIKMKLTPEEAINAATINAAYAMGVSDTLGSITKNKKANLIITDKIPSYGFLPYSFGNNHIDQIILDGKFITY
ncbi:imidazolonepropionase [Mesonia hippocampi]|uniref:Imidazolonepropionase n=1 Tax=Mesonia hippocampi TaxID=1628250 RepID=A0A840ER43_9FLAO|nr:imidazolonepropionase [Mesonia hippocampi]MBB4119525.1 imidazolonepropionase [Mesonia hippocampi]